MKTKWFMMSALVVALMAGPTLSWAEDAEKAPPAEATQQAAPAQPHVAPMPMPMPMAMPMQGQKGMPMMAPQGSMPPKGMMMMQQGSQMAPMGGMQQRCPEMAKAPALSEAKMKELHEAMMQSMESLKKVMAKMPDLQEKKHQILIASKFNAKAYASVEAQISKIHATIREARVKTFLKVAATATPEERLVLSMMVEEGPLGGCGGPRHGRMMPPMPSAPLNAAGMGPHGSAPEAEKETKAPVEDAKPESPSKAE